jgi:hypothetical protein
MRREVGRGPALALTGSCALLLLTFRHYSFWPRPEPFQLAAVAAALLFAVSERGFAAAALVGLCAGILVNLKLTGPMYVLPVFAILQARAGWRAIFVAAAVGTIVAAIPFAAFSNVSLANYLEWVRLSAKTGLVLATLKQNLEWATYFSLPLLLSYFASTSENRPGDVEWRNTMAALLAGLAGVAIAAAKPGAGPYHVLPFLPVVFYLTSRHLAARFASPERAPAGSAGVDAAALAFLVSAAFIAVAQQAQFITTMSERRQVRDVDDVLRFAESHRGEVAIGYGDIEALTLIRPILTFRSNSYFIDQPAIREHQLQGVTLPASTIEALGRCRVNYWLIPKGETPFNARNSYPAVILMSLYPSAFRDRFFATHTLVESTTYFDAWQCHPGSAP